MFPDRDRASDGFIGDAEHASRNSDHNPWVKDRNGVGVVRAWDCDAGPGLNPTGENAVVGRAVAECARRAGMYGHPAMKSTRAYVIYDRHIASARTGWKWEPFSGDPHTSHPHVSVGVETFQYDSDESWNFSLFHAAENVAQAPLSQPEPEDDDMKAFILTAPGTPRRFLWAAGRVSILRNKVERKLAEDSGAEERKISDFDLRSLVGDNFKE